MSDHTRPTCPSCGYVFDHDAAEGQLYRCAHCREFFRVGEGGQAALREQSTPDGWENLVGPKAGRWENLAGPRKGIDNPDKAPKEVLWVVVAVSAGLAALVSGYLSVSGVYAGSVLRAQVWGIIAPLIAGVCCYGLARTIGGKVSFWPRHAGRIGFPLFMAIASLPLWFVVARAFFWLEGGGNMTPLKVWLLRNTHFRYGTIQFCDFTDCTDLEYTIVFVLGFFVFYLLWKIGCMPGPNRIQR